MRRFKKGLTFFEVVIALFLINCMIFAMAGTILMFLKAITKSVDRSRGVIVASSVLESYIAEHRLSLEDVPEGTEKYGKVEYFYKITVTESGSFPDNGEPRPYEVNIVVTWKDWAFKDSSNSENDEKRYTVSRSAIVWGKKKEE